MWTELPVNAIKFNHFGCFCLHIVFLQLLYRHWQLYTILCKNINKKAKITTQFHHQCRKKSKIIQNQRGGGSGEILSCYFQNNFFLQNDHDQEHFPNNLDTDNLARKRIIQCFLYSTDANKNHDTHNTYHANILCAASNNSQNTRNAILKKTTQKIRVNVHNIYRILIQSNIKEKIQIVTLQFILPLKH